MSDFTVLSPVQLVTGFTPGPLMQKESQYQTSEVMIAVPGPAGPAVTPQDIIDSVMVINGTNMSQQDRDMYSNAGVLVLRIAP